MAEERQKSGSASLAKAMKQLNSIEVYYAKMIVIYPMVFV